MPCPLKKRPWCTNRSTSRHASTGSCWTLYPIGSRHQDGPERKSNNPKTQRDRSRCQRLPRRQRGKGGAKATQSKGGALLFELVQPWRRRKPVQTTRVRVRSAGPDSRCKARRGRPHGRTERGRPRHASLAAMIGRDRARAAVGQDPGPAGTCQAWAWHGTGMDACMRCEDGVGTPCICRCTFSLCLGMRTYCALFVLVFLLGVWCLDTFRAPMTFLSCSTGGRLAVQAATNSCGLSGSEEILKGIPKEFIHVY